MSIDNIVRIDISTQSLSMAQKGFGVPLIIGGHLSSEKRVFTYSDLSEVPKSDEIIYKMAQIIFAQSPKVTKIKIGFRAKDEDITQSFQNIFNEDSDFYGVLLASNDEKEILELSELISSKRLLLGVDISNPSLGEELKSKSYKNIFSVYKNMDKEYPSAAWMGKMLPKAPGIATWAFQQLAGISKTNLSANLVENLKKQNINYYTNIADVGVTLNGKTASGEYIDVICGIDWLYARLQERLFRLLMINEKIPYTLKGIDLVRSEIIAQLKEAVYQGVLASDPEPQVSTPSIDEIDPETRGNRILPKVKFSSRLQGAIHEIHIEGTVGP